MNTIFINSEISRTPNPHRLLLDLTDKTNLKKSDKYFALSNLAMYYAWKFVKKSYKFNTFDISGKTCFIF